MEFTAFADVLLPRLGAATIQSVILVSIVWALCRYMPRLGAAARCWLWWLVPLQLLIALVWPMPLGLPVLPASDAMQVSGLPADQSVAPALVEGLPGWSSVLLLLWLAGVVGMTASTLRGYLVARRRLAQSRPCDNSQVLHAYRQLGAALDLRRLPELRVSDSIDSPQLIGPLRPVVLIPETRMARDELDMVLRHELMHWARRDLWWGWLPALAQHAFFFNPVAHLAVREYALAREAACDAGVLSGHRHAPQDYGRLLLRLGAASPPCAGVGSASPTFQLLKRRLTMLQHATSPSHAGMLGLSIAVAVLGVVPYRIVARPLADLQARLYAQQEVQKALLDARRADQKARMDARRADQKARMDARRADQKARMDAQRADQKARMDAQQADQKARMDAQRADQEAQMDAQQAEHQAQRVRLERNDIQGA
jgi:beta-lactamase regulating signal transducer with metallopeptidase domain